MGGEARNVLHRGDEGQNGRLKARNVLHKGDEGQNQSEPREK